MSITLRPIQEAKIKEFRDILATNNEVCLAGSVGSGKTVMAMSFIEQTPGLFYIQTYGQNVILDMWKTRMQSSMSQEAINRTTIGLPQSYAKKTKIKYDYIIIDEAHQFTDAKMTQTILLENPQAKRIYLTATPSPFVLKGTPIVCLSGLELFKLGYSSDVYLGCVSTNTNITSSDRNATLSVSNESLGALSADVPSDMNRLYVGIINRLRQIEVLKTRPVLSKRATWANTFASLHKTIFFCESINQANEVVAFLNTKKIKCVSSNSKNDINSDEIAKFQTDESIKALVVVDRAQAGFDMPDLVNVVDMTFTHNPNRLYQMYGRVTRQSKEHGLKYFFKITNENDIFYTKFYMNVMINMLDETFITKFNGRNLNDMTIKIKKIKSVDTENEREESERNNELKKPGEKEYKLDEDFFNIISVNDHFKFIESRMGTEFNEYANVKISEVRAVEFSDNINIHDIKNRKEELIEMARNGKDRPNKYDVLSHRLRYYMSDAEFSKLIQELRPDWFESFQQKQKRKSYNDMMSIIPETVKFKENQEWKGSLQRHVFICAKYGEFEATYDNLRRSWSKGNSGHPKNRTAKAAHISKCKKVRNVQTGEIFKSCSIVSSFLKVPKTTFLRRIRNGIKCGGFNWEYVE